LVALTFCTRLQGSLVQFVFSFEIKLHRLNKVLSPAPSARDHKHKIKQSSSSYSRAGLHFEDPVSSTAGHSLPIWAPVHRKHLGRQERPRHMTAIWPHPHPPKQLSPMHTTMVTAAHHTQSWLLGNCVNTACILYHKFNYTCPMKMLVNV